MDLNCVVQKQIPVPIDPYDVEDLAVSGRTLVLSDTGDNLRTREQWRSSRWTSIPVTVRCIASRTRTVRTTPSRYCSTPTATFLS